MKFLLIFLLTSPSIGYSKMYSKAYLDKGFKKAAEKTGTPEPLLRAICYAESRHKPSALFHGDGGRDNHAIGMCQLLISTAKSLTSYDPKCHRDFRTAKQLRKAKVKVPSNFKPIPRIYSECKLFGPHTNILAAAKYIKKHLNRYGGNWLNAAAAYNAGSVKACPKRGYVTSPTGIVIKCIPGGLLNQKYVDRVMRALHQGN